MKVLNVFMNKKRLSLKVEDEVYREYYRFKEREDYLEKKARMNESSIEFFELHGVSFENNFSVQLPSTEELYFQNLEKIALNRAIKMLPKEDQYIIIATFYLGRKGIEIASDLGISPGSVTKRRKKILNKLYDILKDA